MKMKTHLPKTVKFIKCEEEKIDEDPLSRERCAAQCSLMPRAMCAHLLANIFHNVYYLVIGLQHLISWHLWQRLKKIITNELGDHGPRSLFLHGNIFRSFQYLSNRYLKLLTSIFHNVLIFHVFCLIHFNI